MAGLASLRGFSVEEILVLYETGREGLFASREDKKFVLNTINEKIIFDGGFVPDVYRRIYDMLEKDASLSADPSCSHREIQNSNSGAIQSGSGIDNDLLYIRSLGESERYIKKFNLMSRRLAFTINDVPEECNNPLVWLQEAIDEVLNKITSGFDSSDLVGLRISNQNFPEKPMGISFRRRDQLSTSVILDVAAKILQSNAAFFSSDVLTIEVDRIRLPSGSGRGRNKMTGVSYEELCRRRYGILTVTNTDGYCLAYALVLAMAYVDNDPEFPKLKIQQTRAPLRDRVSRLCRNADVDLTQGGNYLHITKFQAYLTGYTIIVYDNRSGSSTYFEGVRSQGKKCLNLLLGDGHFNVILSLTAAFATNFFCEHCKLRFENRRDHKNCPYICPCCHTSPPCALNNAILECKLCNREFRGQECFNFHKSRLCKELFRCKSCLVSVWSNKNQPHKCGYKRCPTCMKEMPIRHHCYMQPVVKQNKKSEKTLPDLLIFYDFETRQEKSVGPQSFIHEVNLCVSQQVCTHCMKVDDMSVCCERCGVRQHIFNQVDPVDEFLAYVARTANKFKITAIAHNMRGFDGCFILQKLFSDISKWQPHVIRNGLKIISITCNNIRFVDSLNFIPLPLSKLPDTFNFEGVKGYFPHLFNKQENRNYNGPLPHAAFYLPDSMTTQEHEKFLLWYNEQTDGNVLFNMESEILKYCIGDVNILRKACLKFRECFQASNGVDPFLESTTIASACNLVFRRNFLKPDTIALLPNGGYRMADKQSAIAIKWLTWVSYTQNLHIEHAGLGREVRIKEGVLVDGFCRDTNTVYQFHGCYFHGCERCFPHQNAQLSSNKAKDMMFMRREQTSASDSRIRKCGYNLIIIWECEFNRQLKDNPDLRNYLNQNDILKTDPLEPRDAFYGGRTNACRLYHKAEEREFIYYFDVTSLYPFVNKYGKYPIGHPKKIHVGHQECSRLCIETIDGLVKCTVLPPRNLYHPVLPYKTKGKLTFPLCRVCVETLFQGECRHNDEQRCFVGTYVADELQKPISLGYKVTEYHEIWQYDTEKYDPMTKNGGLFADYVNHFLKVKQEASGWPKWCTTDLLKQQYIDTYETREGIKLEANNIAHNAGMRYLSKLMLNSFWGKFGQRAGLTQTSIVDKPIQLYEHLTNPSIRVHDMVIISDDVLLLAWDRVDESISISKTTSVPIAAYTTTAARLELYKFLEVIGERVIYFDTDSIIFTCKPGQWKPPLGDFLGDLTDEIVGTFGSDSRIVEFVSGGPKNYALKIHNSDTNTFNYVCKVKGITLNFKNSKIINFDSIKDSVLNNNATELYVHNDRKIVRNKYYDVISKPETKMYRVHYTKRKRLPDGYDSVPYGFLQ